MCARQDGELRISATISGCLLYWIVSSFNDINVPMRNVAVKLYNDFVSENTMDESHGT